jgi:cyclopropane fatty-acyl-phospholipid synthase-like methyltransferase
MLKFIKSPSLQAAVYNLLNQENYSPEKKTWLRQISTRVHKYESGYISDGGEHYLKVGLSAMKCIHEAMDSCGLTNPISILDFPCGYGRVMRFLKAAFPRAQIEGADLDKKANRFCSRIFGAKTLDSKPDLEELKLENKYDLIWCGSLVTHLEKERIATLLHFFFRHLNQGGICVFTSHGVRVEDLLARGEINYSLTPDLVEKVLKGYRESGAGFSEYNESREGYGISLTSDAVIRTLAAEAGDWSCVYFEPAGWDNHQDVYAFRKDG